MEIVALDDTQHFYLSGKSAMRENQQNIQENNNSDTNTE